MIDRIKFICKLVIVLVVLGVLGSFVYYYIIKTIRSTQKYAYNIIELNMQSAVISYFLSDSELLVSKFTKKVGLEELVTSGHLDGKSIATECNQSKSYVIGTVDDNKSISYQVCLICEGYKSDSCS